MTPSVLSFLPPCCRLAAPPAALNQRDRQRCRLHSTIMSGKIALAGLTRAPTSRKAGARKDKAAAADLKASATQPESGDPPVAFINWDVLQQVLDKLDVSPKLGRATARVPFPPRRCVVQRI